MKIEMRHLRVTYQLICSIVILMEVVNTEEGKKPPSGMSRHQYCHGCIATVTELLKKVPETKKSGREAEVIEAMENICSNRNFRTYQYSPPKTVKACTALLQEEEEEIERALTKFKGGFDLVKEVCHEITGACVSVDLEDKDARFSDIDLTKDGSVKIDPVTGKAEPEKKKDAKTKKKKDAKTKKKKEDIKEEL